MIKIMSNTTNITKDMPVGINNRSYFSKICRTCLQTNIQNLQIVYINSIQMSINHINRCCPELNLRIDSKPILCLNCFKIITVINQYVCRYNTIKEQMIKIIPLTIRYDLNSYLSDYFNGSLQHTVKSEELDLFNNETVSETESIGSYNNISQQTSESDINELLISELEFQPKPFQCLKCNYSSTRKYYLKRHMDIHNGDKLFKCFQCRYSCKQKFNLVRHIRIHTGEKPLRCTQCNYTSSRKDHLNSHIHIHSENTRAKPFECSECGYNCIVKRDLLNHIRIHIEENLFQSLQGNYSCAAQCRINKDMRIYAGEKPYKCLKCDYRSVRKDCLKRHMNLLHNYEKSFECLQCSYRCSLKWILVKHMQIHTVNKSFKSQDKPFKCSQCDYTSSRKDHLKKHAFTHTRAKPFQCSHCDYNCIRKRDLVQHSRIHNGKKLFICSQCNYSCTEKWRLIKHMRTNAGEKLLQ